MSVGRDDENSTCGICSEQISHYGDRLSGNALVRAVAVSDNDSLSRSRARLRVFRSIVTTSTELVTYVIGSGLLPLVMVRNFPIGKLSFR